MYHIKNHKQLNIFDPWEHLGAKRRKELDRSWAGIFRKHILLSLPVEKLRPHFHAHDGRRSKELYSMMGLMILQQMHDLTDEQAVEQFAFNIKWHYALDITNSTDAYSYVSLRSIWKMRDILTKENLYETLFHKITAKLAKIFKADFSKQRLDSVHIRSNMRHLGRISLLTATVKRFLVNLKRHHRPLFDKLDKSLRARYLEKKQEAVFALVKPSESGTTLNQIAQDIFALIDRFKGHDSVRSMGCFKLLVRLFQEQCIVEESDGNRLVLAKPNKDVPSDSLQNPSDPDAGYSGHKGKGYSVQVMETYSDDKTSPHLPLITHIAVASADNSDAHALIPALEKTEETGMKPKELLADTSYGSDDNVVAADRDHEVEVVAPLSNAGKDLSLSDFTLDDSGHIVACPEGNSPQKTRFKKRFSAAFSAKQCRQCSQRARCPVSEGKKAAYLRYTLKDVRIARRRIYERSSAFRERYRFRAGVEATMAEYDRITGVKKLRVRGLAAVSYAAFLKAIGINLKRAAAFYRDALERGNSAEFVLLKWLILAITHFKDHIQERISRTSSCFGRLRPDLNLRRLESVF